MGHWFQKHRILFVLLVQVCLWAHVNIHGQEIIFDFDQPSDLSDSFNIWTSSSGDVSFIHAPGAGIGSSGGLKPVIPSYYRGDKATLPSRSFSLAPNSNALSMSLFFQYDSNLNQVPNNDGKFLVGFGLVPDSNAYMKDAVSGDDSQDFRIGFGVSRGVLRLSVDSGTGGGLFDLSGNVVDNNWYQLRVEFERRQNSLVSTSASLQDFGADGLTPGLVVGRIDNSLTHCSETFCSDPTLFPSIRVTADGGIIAIDQITIVPEPKLYAGAVLAICLITVFKRRKLTLFPQPNCD